jgi:hypothetical protein
MERNSMSEEAKANDQQRATKSNTGALARRFRSWLPVAVLLAAFLAGLVPMWLKSSRLEGELDRSRRQLRREQIELKLARAVLDARHGDYEGARKGMESFFNVLTAELDLGIGSALSENAFYDLQPLLDERDEIITLLARGDPAAVGRLAEAYVLFRQASGPYETGVRFQAQDGEFSTSSADSPST